MPSGEAVDKPFSFVAIVQDFIGKYLTHHWSL
jgi:hypothetical protein